VRWAALLHDVGHVPLGHTLEDEFEGLYVKHDSFKSRRIPHLWHEVSPGLDSEIRRVFRAKELLPESFQLLGITGEEAWEAVMLICLHKEETKDGRSLSFEETVNSYNGTQFPFVNILKSALQHVSGKIFFPYMADIVGNTICADYLDYLRRDATNVGLDELRDNRVASRFFVANDRRGLFRMVLTLEDRHGKPRLDTCTGVVELVRQRFRFAEIIYYHKTKVAASAMLAKVFGLIGTPDDVGPASSLIEIDRIPAITNSIIKDLDALNSLREKCSPSNLLDPSIGDESLLLWLQERTWNQLTLACGNADRDEIGRLLRGLSLLQALTHRRLYKVCFAIDKNAYRRLSPGSKEDPQIEDRIQETLRAIRDSAAKRTELEKAMATAAKWPEDALLLYVPPRKSQAKGIETKALDEGDVVTLGSHSAVKDEVAHLNDAYKGLWRMILLVHPKFRQDTLGLSRAVEALLVGLWSNVDLREASAGIKEAAFFHYVPERHRSAAEKYSTVMGPDQLDWECFERAAYETTDGTVSTEEHAERAVLLSLIVPRGGSPETVKKQFAKPNSLSHRLRDLEPQLTVEGREGINELHRAALEKVAAELTPQVLEMPGEEKTKRRKSRAQSMFLKEVAD
jgi:hypothetical protein